MRISSAARFPLVSNFATVNGIRTGYVNHPTNHFTFPHQLSLNCSELEEAGFVGSSSKAKVIRVERGGIRIPCDGNYDNTTAV